MKKKVMRGSTASIKTEKGSTCDLDLLAETYVNYGNVPKSIGDIKAMEIALLAQAYLNYRDKDKNKYPRRKRR